MTYEEFLVELQKTPRNWYFKYDTRIRLAGHKFSSCPISSLKGYDVNAWCEAAIELCLDENIAARIVDAADGAYPYNKQIRADLLKACGLTSAQ